MTIDGWIPALSNESRYLTASYSLCLVVSCFFFLSLFWDMHSLSKDESLVVGLNSYFLETTTDISLSIPRFLCYL